MLTRLFAAIALLIAVPASAQTVSVSSPGNVIAVTLTLNGEGRMQYRVDRLANPVIADSQLGFLFTDQPQMLRNFEIVAQRRSDHDEIWTTPWGEDRKIRNHYRELDVDLIEKNNLKRRVTLEFRVYDDGVGFRYRLPARDAAKATNIAEELILWPTIALASTTTSLVLQYRIRLPPVTDAPGNRCPRPR